MTRRQLGTGLAVVSLLVVLLSFPASCSAQTSAGEWRAYAGDVRATKYSPLDQITRNNISQLRIAWRQSAVPVEARPAGGVVNVPSNYEHTPLMAGGLLYMSTAIGTVAALNPATGGVVWAETRSPGAQGAGGGAARGLAYWSDGSDARVVSVQGRFLVALDATTGRPSAGFGDGGRVDLAAGYDRPNQGFRWGGPPLIVRNVIVIGGVPAPATDYLNENARAVKEAPAELIALSLP